MDKFKRGSLIERDDMNDKKMLRRHARARLKQEDEGGKEDNLCDRTIPYYMIGDSPEEILDHLAPDPTDPWNMTKEEFEQYKKDHPDMYRKTK
jgi:hypothetical protein